MDVSCDRDPRKIHNPQTRIFSPTQTGTPAPVLEDASMPVRPQPTKEERAAKMLALGKELRSAYLKKQIGRTVDVLFEAKQKNGLWTGCTANYTPVCVASDLPLAGKTASVEITDADADETCCGVIRN